MVAAAMSEVREAGAVAALSSAAVGPSGLAPGLRSGVWEGDRVTVAAGIRLSTRKVYKVDTLEWKLTGLVNPDAVFDIANRSGRSRAVRSCREIL